jgi:hypothetical protein
MSVRASVTPFIKEVNEAQIQVNESQRQDKKDRLELGMELSDYKNLKHKERIPEIIAMFHIPHYDWIKHLIKGLDEYLD